MRFLGSGDAFGSGGRFQTCLLLEGEGDPVVIDCGASSLIAMKSGGVDPGEIGWVLLTHLHGDHFGGIPFLVLDGQFSRRERPLVVAGPSGLATRVKAAMEVLFPGSSEVPRRFAVEFVELRERTPAVLGPASVTAFVVDHPSGATSFGLRVEYGGRVVAYSGDTAWTEALIDLADGADLFVCEAYFLEKQVRYHLDYRTLAANRDRLRCRRLIVTHSSAELLSRAHELDVEVAADGMTVPL